MSAALAPPIGMGLFRTGPHRAEPKAGPLPVAPDRGRIGGTAEPSAVAARYDAEADRIVIDLANGASFAFPPRLADGLAGARAADLARIGIVGRGHRLRWDRLDEDVSIGALVAGIFATPR